jgi:hypothetical protein
VHGGLEISDQKMEDKFAFVEAINAIKKGKTPTESHT